MRSSETADLSAVLAGEVLCSYGQGTSDDPAQREPDACPATATNITEEGYPYCGEHIEWFYSAVAAIDGRKC